MSNTKELEELKKLNILIEAGNGHLFSLSERAMIFEAMEKYAAATHQPLPPQGSGMKGFDEPKHLIKAGDPKLLLNGQPPLVDCRVIAEDNYQLMLAAINKRQSPQPDKEPESQREEDIYESIYMEVVELVEKDNIQCDAYSETAKKLKEQYIIKKR